MAQKPHQSFKIFKSTGHMNQGFIGMIQSRKQIVRKLLVYGISISYEKKNKATNMFNYIITKLFSTAKCKYVVIFSSI